MSSSSSSEYLYNYYNYGGYYEQNYGNVTTTPFYPTMGNPLIYYANIPQPASCRPRNRENRDGPNCFVKAFRWYTQEHLPPKNGASTNQSTTGFASWLDNKYDEFLEETQDKNQYRVSMKQTSIITAEKIPTICNGSCTSAKQKKKRLLKSSTWKKKRHRSGEDHQCNKENTSFHYILQPKDLTQPNSECCQTSMSVLSSTDVQKRQAYKSQSCTQICQKNREPIDIITTQEGVKAEKIRKDCSQQKIRTKDDACQYSCSVLSRKDAEIQCNTQNENISSILKSSVAGNKSLQDNETMPAASRQRIQSIDCQCSRSVSQYNAHTQLEPEHVTCFCPKKSDTIYQRKLSENTQCPCEINPKQLILGNTTVPLQTSSEFSQTSDYSIILEKHTNCEYPFFMRVICADKLSKENFAK